MGTEPAVPMVVIVYPCGCTYHARPSTLLSEWLQGERLKVCAECRARERE